MKQDYKDEDDSFLQFILGSFLENIKKWWILYPVYPFIWIWYQSLFSENKLLKIFCLIIDSFISLIIFYLVIIYIFPLFSKIKF